MGILKFIMGLAVVGGIIALIIMLPWRVTVALTFSFSFTVWVFYQMYKRSYYD